ncbi:MAG: archease [Candidatus Methanogaster sp.]|uniref:Archease n=1 Tax=Candidatus Methanogaster sp. TaxID=3386292 RepID=A0AC61L3U4_9EURY|nr:MAG: archease [ANME-2 cluster archaeon]
MQTPNIEYLDHPADVKFRVHGRTIEEAFEYAARAMFGVMIDPDVTTIEPIRTIDIDLSADDCKDLLYDFLSELLYLFEVEEIVFGRFDVEQIEQVEGGYHLRAHVSGEPIDRGRHRFEVGVKAVTFHDMVIERMDEGYAVQVLVDT